jgi:hypothetical protein
MATLASCPARFVTPVPRGRGQRSAPSSSIFATAISDFRFRCAMNITLTDYYKNLVQNLVKQGRYMDQNEAVRAGQRLLESGKLF